MKISKKKHLHVYAYNFCFPFLEEEKEKGIVIAVSKKAAAKKIKKEFKAKIADNDKKYYDGRPFLYDFGKVKDGKIYSAFE